MELVREGWREAWKKKWRLAEAPFERVREMHSRRVERLLGTRQRLRRELLIVEARLEIKQQTAEAVKERLAELQSRLSV